MKRSKPLKRSGFKAKFPAATPKEWRDAFPGVDIDAIHKKPRGSYGPAELKAAPKEARAKPGKRPPTAEESIWMDAIVRHGCIACRLDGCEPRETAVHHILRGGRRMGHLYTLPLCDPGHHQGGDALGLVSRHPWKARFEEQYGSEWFLLLLLRAELGFTPLVDGVANGQIR